MFIIKLLYRFIFIICLFILVSCSSNSNQIENTVKNWNQRHLILPYDSLCKNAIGNGKVSLSKKIKILTLIDGNCPSCIETIKTWGKFKNDFDTSKVGLIILWSSTDEFITLENMADSLNKYQPYFFDRNNYIFSANKFPQDLIYHTFLLDSSNNIVLIGAIRNKQMLNLYQLETNKLISKYFSKNK